MLDILSELNCQELLSIKSSFKVMKFYAALQLSSVVNFFHFEYTLKTRLKKFSPRPRGKSVIGKILHSVISQTFLAQNKTA